MKATEKTERKVNWVLAIITTIILSAIMYCSSCMVQTPTMQQIRDANDPAYVRDYVRTIYWDSEVAQIGDFEFLVKDPQGTIFHLLCEDQFTPEVTQKFKVHFKSTKGDE